MQQASGGLDILDETRWSTFLDFSTWSLDSMKDFLEDSMQDFINVLQDGFEEVKNLVDYVEN